MLIIVGISKYTYLGREKGLSLVELLIAVALIGIGIISAMGAFTLIQKSISNSKAHTLAANLAQEKMQIVMQKSYYEILVTSNPFVDNSFSPPITYDTAYFLPETILEGSIWFTQSTYLHVVQQL